MRPYTRITYARHSASATADLRPAALRRGDGSMNVVVLPAETCAHPESIRINIASIRPSQSFGFAQGRQEGMFEHLNFFPLAGGIPSR